MNGLFVQSIARHVLTAGGSVLVAKGYTDEATATAVSGAVFTLFGLVWSFFDKKAR